MARTAASAAWCRNCPGRADEAAKLEALGRVDPQARPDILLVLAETRRRQKRTEEAGRLIEIPSRDDRPHFFTVRQSRPDQVAEVLTAIVSEKALADLPLVTGPSKLPGELLSRWEAEWGSSIEQVVPAGEAARSWSLAEQQAGAEPTRLLTQDDAPPQTIYRVKTRPGRPVLVHIRLPYGASSPRP